MSKLDLGAIYVRYLKVADQPAVRASLEDIPILCAEVEVLRAMLGEAEELLVGLGRARQGRYYVESEELLPKIREVLGEEISK